MTNSSDVDGGYSADGLAGRIAAVLAALVSAVVNVAFLAAFPVGSSLMVLLDIVVIWAVIVRGREMKSDY
ncbi:hypothetical protein [Kribbella sp. NBC_00889]|uniref:DUF7144 family membrane protein n=1 Tax=Kribbella sp. NBC_00889 TaxID=2975974 RepID=UPI00386DD8F6|nr:hypothetical protein OG817_24575 [Kribbella sp. NBC_00889]